MVKDLQGTVDFISGWIKEQAEGAHAKSLIVGISGGVDSALVAALCAKTGMLTVGVQMPCHSSPNSLARGQEVINAFKLQNFHTVNLEKAFDCIREQVANFWASGDLTLNDPKPTQEAVERFQGAEATGALRSCLRAPTLDFVGKIYQGIIVGTGNRDEDEVTRYFQKRGDGCVDISPIAKLHKSEVYELSKFLGVPQSVLDAKPSADLWGPDSGQEDEKQLGLTYDEIEWGIRYAEEQVDGTRYEHFAIASVSSVAERQASVLVKLAHMERSSRHKENPNLPVCNVRAYLNLVE